MRIDSICPEWGLRPIQAYCRRALPVTTCGVCDAKDTEANASKCLSIRSMTVYHQIFTDIKARRISGSVPGVRYHAEGLMKRRAAEGKLH
jgi:hypothetical protein